MSALAILTAIHVLTGAWLVAVYNGLAHGRNPAAEAQCGMDAQRKRRAGLIPNLVSTVNGSMDHERGVSASVTAARYQLEGGFSTALGHFMAVAENCPALRASENLLALQQGAFGHWKRNTACPPL